MAGMLLSRLFLLIVEFLILTTQVLTNPLLAPTPKQTPLASSKALAKPVTIDLSAVWKAVPNKVPAGGAIGYEVDRTKNRAYSTALFHGCTIVIVANGKHVIIGHFAQESAQPSNGGRVVCIALDDEKVVNDRILPKLVDAEYQAGAKPEPQDGTQAWIITTAYSTSPGHQAIERWLTSHNVAAVNVHDVHYSGGSTLDDESEGKAVVQWTTGQNGGGTLAVFIQCIDDTFHQNLDRNGAPLGQSNKGKRDAAWSAPQPGSGALNSTSTNSNACQICTRVNDNEDRSTTKSITKTTTETSNLPNKAQVTVQAGSSPVHVGGLTGTALSTSMSKALAKLCPTPSKPGALTACSTGKVFIPDIDYVDDGFLATDGSIDVKVESSSYNQTSLRNAMIDSAAMTAMHATLSKSNCYQSEYENEPFKMRLSRRNTYSDYLLPGFAKRALGIEKGEGPEPSLVKGPMWCNTVGFAGVQYYNKYWRLQATPGPTDWIDASWSFRAGNKDEITCDFLQDLTDALIAVAPEFVVGDIELGEDVKVGCDKMMDHVGKN